MPKSTEERGARQSVLLTSVRKLYNRPAIDEWIIKTTWTSWGYIPCRDNKMKGFLNGFNWDFNCTVPMGSTAVLITSFITLH